MLSEIKVYPLIYSFTNQWETVFLSPMVLDVEVVIAKLGHNIKLASKAWHSYYHSLSNHVLM